MLHFLGFLFLSHFFLNRSTRFRCQSASGKPYSTMAGSSTPDKGRGFRKRMRFITRYLSITPTEDASPGLADYFRVALSFAALGAWIRRRHQRKKVVSFSRRAALRSIARKRMESLRCIASRAAGLERRSSVEQAELRRQLEEAGGRRREDAKANEKVMAMFSTQEQRWKAEEKRLKGEVEKLRKDLAGCIARLQAGRGKRCVDSSCLECKVKELTINDLRDQVKEKEFLMAAATEDGDIKHDELAHKLEAAEKMVETLEEELTAESEARKAAEAMAKVWKEKLSSEFEVHQAAVDELKRKYAAEAETLEAESRKLREELKVQEKALTTVFARINGMKDENVELVEKLDAARAIPAVLSRLQRFDLQGVQQRELQVYAEQVGELEKQLKFYQQRVHQLEECALLRLDRFTATVEQGNNAISNSSAETETKTPKDFHLTAAKSLLAQYIDADRARDLELGKWRRLYSAAKMAMSVIQTERPHQGAVASKDVNLQQFIDAAKAQQAAELSERHWYEIDTFERLMKAKDERMEGLRMHLLSLERQVKIRESELKEMASRLDAEASLREEVEEQLQETRQELQSAMEESTSSLNSNRKPSAISKKKKRLRNEDKEPEVSVREVLEQSEAELHGKDLQLAFVEAKLVETQMQYKKEKRSRENLVADVLRETEMLEHLMKDGGQQQQHQPSIRNAIAAACQEVDKLSEMTVNSPSRVVDPSREKTSEEIHDIATEAEKAKAKDLAGILAKQLQDYHILLQKINDLSLQAEQAAKTSSLLPRSLELQREVLAMGRKLSIHDKSSLSAPSREPSRVLAQHLAQIQKRLETKAANLTGRCRLNPSR